MALVNLPLLMKDHVKGKRSAVTCALKCSNQCMGELCNTSASGYFRDIVSAALTRRAALGGGAAGALAIAVGGTQGALAAPAGGPTDAKGPKKPPAGPLAAGVRRDRARPL